MKPSLRLCGITGLMLALTASASSAEGDHECLIEPHIVVKVGSPAQGVLASVEVDRGDTVKAGQTLARLRSGVELAALELAKARADFAQRKAARNETLYQKKLISIHERDEMETEKILARLELREVRERLKQRTIYSPISGVVMERSFTAGEFVEETEILKIAQVDPLNVEVIVPIELYGRLTVGESATVTTDAPVGGQFEARVVLVDPVVDAASGTLGVRLELPNPERRIPAGIRCRVRFAGEALANQP